MQRGAVGKIYTVKFTRSGRNFPLASVQFWGHSLIRWDLAFWQCGCTLSSRNAANRPQTDTHHGAPIGKSCAVCVKTGCG